MRIYIGTGYGTTHNYIAICQRGVHVVRACVHVHMCVCAHEKCICICV